MNKKQEIKNRIDLINKGEIPEGYKKYHGFVHPIDWKHISFNKIFKERCIKVSDTSKYPLYSLTIENGVIPKTEQYERSFLITKDEDSYKVVKNNDFVYNPMNLRFGAIARYKDQEDCSVSGYYNVFSIINSYNPYFMESFVKSQAMLNYYNTQATGSLIEKQRVHFSQFIEFNFALPSEKEQEKIAEILSCCDKVIELKEQLIKHYYEKRNFIIGYFLKNIKSKNIVKLGDVCEMFSGGTPSVENRQYYNNGTIPFIKSGEIENDQTEDYITEDGLKNSSAKLVKQGDLLVALYGANSGNVALSKISGAINQAILCIRSSLIDSYYLLILLKFNKDRIIQKYLQGGQGNLSAQIIKSLKFKIPTIEEQKKIVTIISNIDKELKLLEQELEQYKQFKKSLSQLLLTGIVRVNEV